MIEYYNKLHKCDKNFNIINEKYNQTRNII